MRVTSDFWVSSLMRRVYADGGFAAIQRKGASEAGAIIVVNRQRTGVLEIYLPASQTYYDDSQPSERLFSLKKTSDDDQDVEKVIEREVRFDPDIWVVEVELASEIESYLTIAKG